MGQTFSRGARGFLVEALQDGLERALGRRLPSGRDGKYFGETQQAVVDFVNRQPTAIRDAMLRERAAAGEAGPKVWTALGLDWPEIFARCLQLTSCFEGTGFTGAEGPKQTSDSAGVTYGLIGFTSYNGELQELLESARVDHAQEFEFVGIKCLGTNAYRKMRQVVVDEEKSAFAEWALDGSGSVRESVKMWLEALGELTWMKHLQMYWAYHRYFKKAAAQAKALFGDSATDRAHALMFDVAVQNGGLSQIEVSDLAIDFAKDPAGTETDRMHAVNTMLIQRLRNKNRPANIIDDVRSRKNTIAAGIGKVHGDDYLVRGFAL